MQNITSFSEIDQDTNDCCLECLNKEGQINALTKLLKTQEDISKKLARMVGSYEHLYGVNESINEKFFGKQSSLKIVR